MQENMRIIADMSGMDALARRYPEIGERARTARVTEAIQLLDREVRKDTPYGAGPIHLRDSIFPEVRAEGDKVVGILGTPLEHGLPVEHGTKPHFPPIAPLIFWVEKILGLSGDEAESAAYAIAVTISRKGTEGAGMFKENMDEHEARIMAILERIPSDIREGVERL